MSSQEIKVAPDGVDIRVLFNLKANVIKLILSVIYKLL
jgi:hypothetical protein